MHLRTKIPQQQLRKLLCCFTATNRISRQSLAVSSIIDEIHNPVAYELFRAIFFTPAPTHFKVTVFELGSGLITNMTLRKSLMFRSVSIPCGVSCPTRTFDTSAGHKAHRINRRPCKYLQKKCNVAKQKTSVNYSCTKNDHAKQRLIKDRQT